MLVENDCPARHLTASLGVVVLAVVRWEDLIGLAILPTSTRVFHSWQAGHWPDHLANSLPQELHIKRVEDFAIETVYTRPVIKLSTIDDTVPFWLFLCVKSEGVFLRV